MPVFICKTGINPVAKTYDPDGAFIPEHFGASGETVNDAIESWIEQDHLFPVPGGDTLPEYIDVYELVLKEQKVRV